MKVYIWNVLLRIADDPWSVVVGMRDGLLAESTTAGSSFSGGGIQFGTMAGDFVLLVTLFTSKNESFVYLGPLYNISIGCDNVHFS